MAGDTPVTPFMTLNSKPPGFVRLLLLIPWMNMGGADRFNLELTKQLTRRGFQITVCATIAGGPWLNEFLKYTSDIFILPNFLRPLDYPRFLRYSIESRQVDIVLISNSMLGYILLPYFRSVCPTVAYADYNHMVVPHWRSGGFPRFGVNYQPYLDLNIVSSEQVKQWMISQGADAERIEVCYINVDPAEWNPILYDRPELRRAMDIPQDIPVILYPARLEPQKRPQMVLEILSILRHRDQRFLCIVAGDGPQRRLLARGIARYGLQKHIRMLGAVSPEQMPALMTVSDILLLPSQYEGISLAIYEAMAMGVVPVSADVGGQRELVTPDAGFLIPPGPDEVEAYVTVLARLLESPELRTAMGRKGRERICAHFTADQMGERMVQIVQRAQYLSRAAPRPPVSEDEGLMVAAQAVEMVQLESLQDLLRVGEDRNPFRRRSPKQNLRQRIAYHLRKRVFRPLYYWGVRNGLDWIEPLAGGLYRWVKPFLE